MSEARYRVEELGTVGWSKIKENLSRSQASELLQSLMNEGTNPDRLRAIRED